MLLKSEITQAITSQQQQLLSQQTYPCKAHFEWCLGIKTDQYKSEKRK